jgi:hypothetical protein
MIEFLQNKICRKVLAGFSSICFIVSLFVHCFSIFEINLIRNSLVFFYFHAFIFIPFGAFVTVSQSEFKLYKLTEGNNYQKWFFSLIPKSVKYLAYIFSVYVFLNFFLLLPLTSTVRAEIFDGKYVLFPLKAQSYSQNIIREISKEEYEKQTSYNTRLFSGHWMIFYLMPSLFFFYNRPKSNWLAVNNNSNA